ncbi:MAG: DapH/DapD/GlmU-related protein, partial [Prevotellaceae bacterium]|nr:DapH/DapD/GlmU-related protein [Prevotellaceae bacterium]
LVILDPAPVTFGDHCFIAPNCCFTTATHPLDVERRNAGLETCKPIKVGNNVWIGANVTVLPGVTIGDGAVVAAGALVNRDVEAGTLIGGVPAKLIRRL